MRIGLFGDTYFPEINGVATSIKTLEDELIKLGHEVYIITTKADFSKPELEGRVLRLPGIELKFLYGYVLTSPLQISAFNIVRSLDLDIIHAHTEFGIGIFARICSRLLSIPLVSTYHTTYEDYTHYVNFINSNIVDNVANCYQALGIIHANFTPIPKRFKDYIAMPKPNLYQSLHTTVLATDGTLFEIGTASCRERV